jgi:hypothetical protein
LAWSEAALIGFIATAFIRFCRRVRKLIAEKALPKDSTFANIFFVEGFAS